MDRILFGGFTVQDVLIIIGIIIALLIVIGILKKIFKKNESDRHTQVAECGACGWKGRVSQYAGRCPKCNQPLGNQKIKTGF